MMCNLTNTRHLSTR